MQRQHTLPKGFGPLDFSRLPRHVALIMDGNGRWAKQQGKIRTLGHKAGMDTVLDVVRASDDIGLEALTLYAFSTENWNRPRFEVEALMVMWLRFLRTQVQEIHERNGRVRFIGENGQGNIPRKLLKEKSWAEELTKDNTGMTLNVCLNYGSRKEMMHAVKALAQKVKDGEMQVEDIDEEAFSAELYTGGLPDPDLLIRTSGENRLSNFLLYQVAYTEFIFTKEHWPEFTNEVYYRCLNEYMARNRRFGAIKEDA